MRNIIITGGGLANKGAQAMTLITVDALRQRYPEHQIFLYSEADRHRPQSEKAIYNFDFTGWYPLKFARCQQNPFLRAVTLLKNHSEFTEAEKIYKNTDFIVDISGYALGSNWSDKICNDFLDILEFAQCFEIPVYLMPQSFGPFDFGQERKELDRRIQKLLPTVKMIFAREQEGYDAIINTYNLTNVYLAQDLVLSSKEIDLACVFKTPPDFIVPTILPKSVALIPNVMNASVVENISVQSFFEDIINDLVRHEKNVYIIAHSEMDVSFCRSLKEAFNENRHVIFLDRDFNCLEFNELVKQFDYCVASRYHSIVHAYKKGVPCIAVGWAAKYLNLLKLFGQEQYMFDLRKQVNPIELSDAITRIEKSHRTESDKILRKLARLQEQNVFDILSEYEKK